MKNRRLKLLLICSLLSVSLCACNKKEAVEEPTTQEEVQQAVNLSGVTAGQVLNTETLIDYANTLAGITDVNAVSCYTETESNVTEVTLQEGIHTITIVYATASGTNGEVSLVYEAGPGEVIEEPTEGTEEVTDESDEEVIQEVSIPIEGRIKLSVTDGTTTMTEEEFSTSETLEVGALINVTDVEATLSMYDPLTTMMEREVSNKYKVSDTYYEYYYDDSNYVATIGYNVYNQDGVVYFEVNSVNSNDKLYFGVKLSEDAVTDDELFNDEVNAVFDTIEDYYTYEFTYDPKIIEDTAEDETEEESTESDETAKTDKEALIEDKLTALVGQSYREAHPELYIWPENPIKYSRWDYRITDSTTFKSNITLEDGTVIPEAQQQQDGYQYTLGNQGYTGTTNNNNNTTSTTQQETPMQTNPIVSAGFKKFEIMSSVSAGATVNLEKATEKSVPLERNGSTYFVKVIPASDWITYGSTDYYGNNPTNMEIVVGESLEIGEGITKTTVQCRTIQFSDSTGATVERQYMFGINCGDSYLVVVGDTQPGRGNETLKNIVQSCIIPLAE